MLKFFSCALSVAAAAALATASAQAHPHVWVKAKSEVVYAPDGSATAIKHHWTFDEMFSTMATQGMGLTREELTRKFQETTILAFYGSAVGLDPAVSLADARAPLEYAAPTGEAEPAADHAAEPAAPLSIVRRPCESPSV